MMKVFLNPIGLHSIAMIRVMNALSSSMPEGFTRARNVDEANIVILHTIGLDAIPLSKSLIDQGKKYIVIQYCGCWDVTHLHRWSDLWTGALFTWSYYDLRYNINNFYYAPLGVDDIFINAPDLHSRQDRILTSGYVSGRPQEPVQDVWAAADEIGVDAFHLGPDKISGMIEYPPRWKALQNIDDITLAHLYSTCKWVSAMRYQEGFELPAIEGLVRGARPICFDQPSIRHWYEDLVEYVPECDGEELIDRLCGIFLDEYRVVTQAEIDYVKHKFDWHPIANGFWRMVKERL